MAQTYDWDYLVLNCLCERYDMEKCCDVNLCAQDYQKLRISSSANSPLTEVNSKPSDRVCWARVIFLEIVCSGIIDIDNSWVRGQGLAGVFASWL